MIPKNTVSITPKQLAELQEVSEYTPIWIENFEIWSCVFCRSGALHSWNSDVRMNEHDFRHFFGDYVDLKDYYDNEFIKFLGFKFEIKNVAEEYSVIKYISGNYFIVKSGSKAVCKRWLCTFFKKLLQKDNLSHLNLKFKFS